MNGQEDKLMVIRDIKKRIDRKRRVFEGKDKEEVDEWYHYLEVSETFGPVHLQLQQGEGTRAEYWNVSNMRVSKYKNMPSILFCAILN